MILVEDEHHDIRTSIKLLAENAAKAFMEFTLFVSQLKLTAIDNSSLDGFLAYNLQLEGR